MLTSWGHECLPGFKNTGELGFGGFYYYPLFAHQGDSNLHKSAKRETDWLGLRLTLDVSDHERDFKFVLVTWRILHKNQGWALRSFPFGMLRSFPF